MNRMLRTLVAGGFIAAATAMSAAGCTDDNSTLFITGVLYTKAPACTVTNDPNNQYLGSGVLDVAFTQNYKAWVLVGNQYTPRGNKDNLKTETTGVNLRGAEITLTNSDGSAIKCPAKTPGCGSFSVFGSGYAASAKGQDPGWGLFAAELIPDSLGKTLAADLGTNRNATKSVVANIKVFGDTLGNQQITSGQLSFPIDICYGCLIQYPFSEVALDPNTKKFICQAGTTSNPTLGCRPGQDDPIDCATCSTTKPACLNVPSN
jgi:hypothetical protein